MKIQTYAATLFERQNKDHLFIKKIKKIRLIKYQTTLFTCSLRMEESICHPRSYVEPCNNIDFKQLNREGAKLERNTSIISQG
jgi:hypothetical protein